MHSSCEFVEAMKGGYCYAFYAILIVTLFVGTSWIDGEREEKKTLVCILNVTGDEQKIQIDKLSL